MPTDMTALRDGNDLDRGKPLVVVAVLTYRRAQMLRTLLSSFGEMRMPVDARVVFLVVDNDGNQSSREIVDESMRDAAPVRYVCEPRRGIPVARNRALDEALAMNANVLCFIDDDECPDREWLVSLVDCWRNTGAGMVGGPVEVTLPPTDANRWQRFVNASLAARMRRKNRQALRPNKRTAILTNNWPCDLRWQRQAGIRFDEALLVSGGSDTAFFREAKAAGVTTAWCARAIVRETMSLARLSLAYQFTRAKAQSITNFRIKNKKVTPGTVAIVVPVASVRFVLGLLLFIVPIYGIASPVVAVRSLGWSVGRICVLRGDKSELYK